MQVVDSDDSSPIQIIGGGLSGCLLANRLHKTHPHIKIQLFEKNLKNALRKTWSFHASDVDLTSSELELFSSYRWSSYEVRFPEYTRVLNLPYCTLKPEKLISETKLLPNIEYCADKSYSPSTKPSKLLFDTSATASTNNCGFQKFLGLRVRLQDNHGLLRPILMDATISQDDGYRFMYVLPFNEKEILIEETHYSENSVLPEDHYKAEIFKYAESKGWQIAETLETEKGILPIPFSHAYIKPDSTRINIGMGAGYFHSVTGYSLPSAFEVATIISNNKTLRAEKICHDLEKLQKARSSQDQYFELLNRLLFHAARPEKRYRIFEHFYRMPEELIKNFYRGEMTWPQKARMFIGRPPVPVFNALKTFFSTPETS